MLQTASVQPPNYSLRVRRQSLPPMEEPMADDDMYDDDADGGGGGKSRTKSRRELPSGAVATLKAWLLSPEHFTHPYPTPQDQAMLMQKTGIDKKQLKNWFTNARRRIWKPMLKKQIEQGTLTTTGPGGPCAMPGLMMPTMPPGVAGNMDNPHSVQAMRVHYQQAMQQQQDAVQQQQAQAQAQTASTDAYGNVVYSSTPSSAYVSHPPDAASAGLQPPQPLSSEQLQAQLTSSSSIGTLPQISSNAQLSNSDSHAVLMELFARDQDLVRQATESARLKAESKQQQHQQAQSAPSAPPLGGSYPQHPGAQQQVSNQHPMKAPASQTVLSSVPTLNSWPQFSSITSLNNLGTMPGVKSIASLSGTDLASKGTVNKMGNLAQVKSMESMGKNDSYAFLEVFFGDRSSTNISGMAGRDGKGPKLGEDDNEEIGLSLEDESPSHPTGRMSAAGTAPMQGAPQPSAAAAPPHSSSTGEMSNSSHDGMDSGMLKRAYDDALAARGLISVSRSSERLTDLILPAKMQRTLSQEFISKQKAQPQQEVYSFAPAPGSKSPDNSDSNTSQQYPGQDSSATEEDGCHVRVPISATCAVCEKPNVDTQLRPCGHMYHERCLKPSLQMPGGQPRCPVDHIPMQSALLAVPTENVLQQSNQPAPAPSSWSSFASNNQPTGTQGV